MSNITLTIVSIILLLTSYTFYTGSVNNKYNVKIETVEGVKVITNPDHPFEGELKLKVIDEVTIGNSGDINEILSHPRDVQIDQNGNIYVFDFKQICIKVFSKEGRFLRKIGRKGQGPGEFTELSRFVLFESDKIFLMDSMLKRFTIFSTHGNLIKSHRFNIKGYCSGLMVYCKNIFYITVSRINYEGVKSKYEVIPNDIFLYLYDLNKNKWFLKKCLKGEFHVLKRNPSGGIEGTMGPFKIVCGINFDGNIVAGLNKDYQLNVFSPDGELLLKFGREFVKRKNKKYKRKLYQYEFLPSFGREIFFDEKCRIWIRQSGDLKKKEIFYDIFSKDGIYLKKVILPYYFIRFKDKRFYRISSTDDDEIVIIRSRIVSGLD